MYFSDLIRNRFSLRKYDTTHAVEEEKISIILEAARIAPTAHNYQPQRIWIARCKSALAKIRNLTPCRYDAPLVFIVGYDENVCWIRNNDGKEYGIVDSTIALTQMMLQAADIGLGSCIVGEFIESDVRAAFELADNIRIISFLLVGYAHHDAKPHKKHIIRNEMHKMVEELT